MPATNGIDPSGVALATLMSEHTPLLAAILAAVRSEVLEIGVGDVKYRQMVLDQFPVAGSKRVLAYRTGAGSDGIAVPTTGALVVVANEARLGGRIVNAGTNNAVLYLTDRPVPASGAPAIYLPSAGGAWDFRLGNLTWCGNVSAIALTGASTLTVAEV